LAKYKHLTTLKL